jgi:hypothetical protein
MKIVKWGFSIPLARHRLNHWKQDGDSFSFSQSQSKIVSIASLDVDF